MNNKGITLIEMMVVAFCMMIIFLLIVPNVTDLIVQSRETEYQNFLSTISLATEAYVQKNRADELVNKNDYICVSIEDLINSKYLKTTVHNPKTKQPITSEVNNKVKVILQENMVYKYEYSEICN